MENLGSLVIQVNSMLPQGCEPFIKETIQIMKFAGGDIEELGQVIELMDSGDGFIEKRLKHELMPGYWLIDRSDLIRLAVNETVDSMQALLNYISVFVNTKKSSTGLLHTYSKKESGRFSRAYRL